MIRVLDWLFFLFCRVCVQGMDLLRKRTTTKQILIEYPTSNGRDSWTLFAVVVMRVLG